MSWTFIEIERRYSDPGYVADWTAEDRPPWTLHNEDQKRAFAVWMIRQLEELERRVRAECIAEIEAAWDDEIIPAVAKLPETLDRAMPLLRAKMQMAKALDPKATVNTIVEAERRAKVRESSGWTGGPGRPAFGADPDTPAARAARDIWRLRHVILPRFWPEGAKRGKGLTNLELAKITALKHDGATASAAEAWYENEKLASFK